MITNVCVSKDVEGGSHGIFVVYALNQKTHKKPIQ
jgi:hypothetical protein